MFNHVVNQIEVVTNSIFYLGIFSYFRVHVEDNMLLNMSYMYRGALNFWQIESLGNFVLIERFVAD